MMNPVLIVVSKEVKGALRGKGDLAWSRGSGSGKIFPKTGMELRLEERVGPGREHRHR